MPVVVTALVSFRFNYYWQTGNRARGHRAERLFNHRFRPFLALANYYCTDCGRIIPKGTSHLRDVSGMARIHLDCGARAQPADPQ